MKLHLACLVTTLMSLVAVASARGQQFQDPYYVVDKTFALDPNLSSGSTAYRISALLPNHTLVFPDPSKITVSIGGEPHIQIVTEDGEKLLIPRKVVSAKSFKDTYKDLTIAFHEDSYYCPEDQKNCGVATGMDITKGSVYSVVTKGSDFIALRGYVDGDIQVGYLTSDRYEQLRSEGVFTDTSLTYPRVIINRITRLESLNTECGETKKTVSERSLQADAGASLEPGDAFNFLTKLSSLLNLNIKLSTLAEFKRTGSTEASYGEPGVAMEFFRVDLRALDNGARIDPANTRRVILVEAKELCLGSGPTAFPVIIKEVSIREGAEGGITAHLSFRDFYATATKSNDQIDQNDKAFRVFQLNGNQPYLTSITTISSYARIKHVWVSQIYDGSIASILMELFNATCPRKQVAGKVAIQVCNDALEAPEP